MPVNATVCRASGAPAESRTSNTRARGSCAPALPRWPPPDTNVEREAETAEEAGGGGGGGGGAGGAGCAGRTAGGATWTVVTRLTGGGGGGGLRRAAPRRAPFPT